ncbi:unnamed protein product, partial [Meganyctiphanes norvegica]
MNTATSDDFTVGSETTTVNWKELSDNKITIMRNKLVVFSSSISSFVEVKFGLLPSTTCIQPPMKTTLPCDFGQDLRRDVEMLLFFFDYNVGPFFKIWPSQSNQCTQSAKKNKKIFYPLLQEKGMWGAAEQQDKKKICSSEEIGFTNIHSLGKGRILLPHKEPILAKKRFEGVFGWFPYVTPYARNKEYTWKFASNYGNFRAGYKQGTILKKLCPAEEVGLEIIMKDVLRPYVPDYMGVVEGSDGERYLQLQDLLSDFSSPCVMDIKMGVRTYLEEELAKAREKPKLRKDMYEKMVQIDPGAPTEAESRAKAVTKPRYMVWRETISSTATLGFRIEGIRRGDGTSSKDFKTTRTREHVLSVLTSFLQGYPFAASRYVQRLKAIKVTLEASPFFNTHELIGSSLLFVHNESAASVWMIDFAKTSPLPKKVSITHREPWSEGTHEDGYLLGMDNIIDLFVRLEKDLEKQSNASNTETTDLNITNTEEVTIKKNNSSSSINSNTCNNSTTSNNSNATS